MVALPWLFGTPEGQVWGLVWITISMSVAGTLLAISFNSMFAEVLPPEWRAHAVARRNILLAVSLTVTRAVVSSWIRWFSANYQIVFRLGRLERAERFHWADTSGDRDCPQSAVNRPVKADEFNGCTFTQFSEIGIFMLSYLAFILSNTSQPLFR
jgi:hypothetical protein